MLSLSLSLPNFVPFFPHIDRMDKPLMIAQMQGKYQHIIIKECGHVMHEDNPDKIAETLDRFAKRNMVRIPFCHLLQFSVSTTSYGSQIALGELFVVIC